MELDSDYFHNEKGTVTLSVTIRATIELCHTPLTDPNVTIRKLYQCRPKQCVEEYYLVKYNILNNSQCTFEIQITY